MSTKLPLLKKLQRNIDNGKRIELQVAQKMKPHTSNATSVSKLPLIESKLKPMTPYKHHLSALKINDKFSLGSVNRKKSIEFAKKIRFTAFKNEENEPVKREKKNVYRKLEHFKSLFIINQSFV